MVPEMGKTTGNGFSILLFFLSGRFPKNGLDSKLHHL
jgi:hypothetical protein